VPFSVRGLDSLVHSLFRAKAEQSHYKLKSTLNVLAAADERSRALSARSVTCADCHAKHRSLAGASDALSGAAASLDQTVSQNWHTAEYLFLSRPNVRSGSLAT